MTTALFKDGFPSANRNTRQRVENSIDLRRLFSAIDADPALIGAGVVYVGFASSSMPGNIKALAIGIYEEASQ